MLLDPVHSTVHFPFYREVPRKSLGRSFAYVAYLGLLFSIAATIAFYLKFSPLLRETVDWAAAAIPTLTFADGKVSSASGLLILRHPRAPEMAFALDTARTTPLSIQEMAQMQVVGCLTQNALYVLSGRDKLESHDLSRIKSARPFVVDAGLYRKLGAALPRVLYPAAGLITWAAFFLWKLVAALFYSLVALLINAATSGGQEYAALFKTAVYAQTPVVLLEAVMLYVPARIPGFFVIALLITSAYVWQALRQQRPEPEGAETASASPSPAP